ncbi:alanine--tRNA ligase-related protein [Escherichia coli]
MNQFKDVFLQLDKRNSARATTSQRCVRAGVNTTTWKRRLHRASSYLFEMLGNLSFGDYFKHDATEFAWELLTSEKWFALPKERLSVTVYKATTKPTKSGKKKTRSARTYCSHRR